ncbi:MAG: hypothetical protein ACI9J2_001285 [Saprospiraceae bacterium]|jgi:hypothetical protein
MQALFLQVCQSLAVRLAEVLLTDLRPILHLRANYGI